MLGSGLHRSKQPQLVRERLLSACVELLVEGMPLSIGEVAGIAGVTKGAVQQRFGTREALLAALYDELEAHFAAEVRTADAGLSAAGAYVAATVHARADAEQARRWRAMLVACVIERALAGRWSSWVQADGKKDAAGVNGKLVARLAADGLWLSGILGTYGLSTAEREGLGAELLRLTEREQQ